MRGVISYNIHRNVLFDEIEHGENFLILYSNTNSHKWVIRNLFQPIADKNSILIYISHKSNHLNLSFDVRTIFFDAINENSILNLKSEMDKCFGKIEKSNGNMLLIADWLNLNKNSEILLPFIEALVQKSMGLRPRVWKRGNKSAVPKSPFTLINALDTANLNEEFIQQLIQMHSRVYLLQENMNTFLLPRISPSAETITPKFYALPQKILEKHVKDNLELIVLILLEKSDKSGYQVLKDIAGYFHCILSQGTLYPLLYRLEKEDKIIKKNGKGREIIYSLSEETKNELKLRKDTCLKAYQRLASFFQK